MDSWLLILSAALTLLLLLRRCLTAGKHPRLPPGPRAVPFLGNLFLLRRSLQNIALILRDLRAEYGPIVTLRVGSRLSIFISDRRLAHEALVEHGAAFSSRPTPLPATRFISSNQHSISSAPYGPLWRLLRRNLTAEILHPSRVKLYSAGRSWVLALLLDDLRSKSGGDGSAVVAPVDTFQFAMFRLLVLMCFGEKLDEREIREIEAAQRNFLLFVGSKLNLLAFLPRISMFLFRERWRTAVELRRRQAALFVPLIRSREQHSQSQSARYVFSYLDSLLGIRIPEEGGRRLTDDETVTLCSEFLNAGTDTTSTALQWIMAELVKHPKIQKKLAEEIEAAVGENAGEVKEEELHRMPYLKAVVVEGLRRHPPGHFVLPHMVTEEVSIGGYVVPKGALVNFMVAEMNWDGEVWEEPMEFRPERFTAGGEGEGVDVSGSREIKMMPFGVGRRICPGLGLAVLHLEYFVANLVREFEWKPAADGEEVDMSEKPQFTVVMRNPLRARIVPRRAVAPVV